VIERLLAAPLPARRRPEQYPPIGVPAVILAAGAGRRLRPVTQTVAKPLVPVLNVPLLYWTVAMLRAAGASALVANVCAFAWQFRDAARRLERRNGVRLQLVAEDRLTGPAGGLTACRGALPEADCYLVTSGDAWTDTDLAAMVARHRMTGADLTILGTTVPDPRPFDVLALRGDEVTGMRERSPGTPRDAVVSCGIYVLSRRGLARLAPTGRDYDFKHVVPDLVAAGLSVQVHRAEGHWTDIGNIAAYLELNLRAAETDLPASGALLSQTYPDLWCQRQCGQIPADVKVGAASLVGAGASVGAGAVLDGAIVGQGARIGREATVRRALVLPGAEVPDGSTVAGEVVV
jgi:mannose-1-phosphate guanylyltransferase